VNLLGPGPRLMKKEFTGPRSHKGWESLVYVARELVYNVSKVRVCNLSCCCYMFVFVVFLLHRCNFVPVTDSSCPVNKPHPLYATHGPRPASTAVRFLKECGSNVRFCIGVLWAVTFNGSQFVAVGGRVCAWPIYVDDLTEVSLLLYALDYPYKRKGM